MEYMNLADNLTEEQHKQVGWSLFPDIVVARGVAPSCSRGDERFEAAGNDYIVQRR